MKRHILIVDDEFGLADVVAEMLQDEGYGAAIAINGRLGLEMLAANHADLVLMDVMMPILDGPGMLRIMRDTPAYAQIPVIMMTALAEALPREKPLMYQAALHKPFSPDRLFKEVARLIGPGTLR